LLASLALFLGSVRDARTSPVEATRIATEPERPRELFHHAVLVGLMGSVTPFLGLARFDALRLEDLVLATTASMTLTCTWATVGTLSAYATWLQRSKS